MEGSLLKKLFLNSGRDVRILIRLASYAHVMQRKSSPCNRCRLKKSKCDGACLWSCCAVYNTLCVFGERKKSRDKIYPKGYAEMLEQQQGQLLQGLQGMYHRMLRVRLWQGLALSETAGQLTHDILSALGRMEKKNYGTEELIAFEEDCEQLQARIITEGSVSTKQRGSVSSNSDLGHYAPVLSKPTLFRENFDLGVSTSPTTDLAAPSVGRGATDMLRLPLRWQPLSGMLL